MLVAGSRSSGPFLAISSASSLPSIHLRLGTQCEYTSIIVVISWTLRKYVCEPAESCGICGGAAVHSEVFKVSSRHLSTATVCC